MAIPPEHQLSFAPEKALKLLGVDRQGISLQDDRFVQTSCGIPTCSSSDFPLAAPAPAPRHAPQPSAKAQRLLGLDPSLEKRASRFFGEDYHKLEAYCLLSAQKQRRTGSLSPPPTTRPALERPHGASGKAMRLLGIDPSLERCTRFFGEDYYVIEQQRQISLSSRQTPPHHHHHHHRQANKNHPPTAAPLRHCSEKALVRLGLDPSTHKAAMLLGEDYATVERLLHATTTRSSSGSGGAGGGREGPQALEKAARLLGIDDGRLAREIGRMRAMQRHQRRHSWSSSDHECGFDAQIQFMDGQKEEEEGGEEGEGGEEVGVKEREVEVEVEVEEQGGDGGTPMMMLELNSSSSSSIALEYDSTLDSSL